MSAVLVIIGFLIAAVTLGTLVWSIVYPARRIWPPKTYSAWTPIVVWVPTLALFGTLIALGVIGWGQMGLPTWLRYGLGIPVVVLSNVVVWSAVQRFGIAQTGGAEGTLKTDGLYGCQAARQIQAQRQLLEIVGIRSAEERVMAGLVAGLLDGQVVDFAALLQLSHEATYRALRKLVEKEHVINPTRGVYSLKSGC
jgi:hypothetical protein